MDGMQEVEEQIDAELALDTENEREENPESDYVPDPRSLWGSEAARAMLVVLTRRLGPDFAREMHDEMTARSFSYQAGCPDDQRDGAAMEFLLKDVFWDRLFAVKPPGQ